jgi:hypothetical protein
MSVYFVFRPEYLKETIHLGDFAVDGRIIFKWLNKQDMGVWTEFISFKIGSSGGLFHKRRTFLDSLQLSQEGLYSMQLLFLLLFYLHVYLRVSEPHLFIDCECNA